jgi:hypothetical protein
MKPEAFLPSNSPGPGAASVVPATPIATGSGAGNAPLKAPLSPAEYYKWAGEYLRNNRTAPREVRLELINWRHKYQLQQEAAEQQANPIAEEELRRVAERFARKAQSGFAGPSADSATTR